MKKLPFKTISYSVALAAVIALTACSSDNGGSAAAPTPSPTPSAVASPAASPGGSPDADAAAQNSPDPASGQASAGDKPANSPGDNQAAGENEAGKQLKELLALAKKGEAPGISFAAHTSLIDDVEKSWGKADQTDAAGKGLYATYGSKNAVFGFNKGSQIFDVRSSDPKLQTLTLEQIEKTLGKPGSTAKNGDDDIYVYEAGEQFQLKFIIPRSTGKVDHISVFSPQDSINNMAG